MKKRVKRAEVRKSTGKKKIGKWLYWTPRVLSILLILFLSLFSLDVFDPTNNYTFWETVLGLLMHNIPVFILIGVLIISWKYEIVGAVGFVLGGILYIGQMIFNSLTNSFEFYMISYSFIIAGPAFLIGFLWWMNWVRKR